MPLTDGVTTNIWTLVHGDRSVAAGHGFRRPADFIARRVSWSADGRSILAAVGEGDADIVVFEAGDSSIRRGQSVSELRRRGSQHVPAVASATHREIAEVRLGADVEPQRDRALAVRARLQVVDDERRLRLVVNVEFGEGPADFDLDLRQLARDEVDVRLVLLGRLLAKPEPRPVRVGDVLRRMIAPDLVVGAAVGRPEVERVVGAHVALQPEGKADRPARAPRRAPAHRRAGNLGFNHAVVELDALDHPRAFSTVAPVADWDLEPGGLGSSLERPSFPAASPVRP